MDLRNSKNKGLNNSKGALKKSLSSDRDNIVRELFDKLNQPVTFSRVRSVVSSYFSKKKELIT